MSKYNDFSIINEILVEKIGDKERIIDSTQKRYFFDDCDNIGQLNQSLETVSILTGSQKEDDQVLSKSFFAYLNLTS